MKRTELVRLREQGREGLFVSRMEVESEKRRYLGNKVDQILKVGGEFLGLELKDGPGGLKVAQLLQEFFLVGERVTLDEVLQLGDVGGQQRSPVSLSHDECEW